MRIFFLAVRTASAAGILACSAAAHADEGSFTGGRIEAALGWDNFSPGSGDGSTDSKDDVVIAGALGYDYEINRFVIGADVELSGSGVAATWSGVNTPTDYLRLKAARDIYLGARLGYAFSPAIMGYVKAGYTNLRTDIYYDPRRPGGTIDDSSSDNDGFRAGIGAEYRLNGGFFVKGEYRYSHYGDNVGNYDVDVDRNQILVGAGYRF